MRPIAIMACCLLACGAALVLQSCQTTPPRNAYAELVDEPLPTTDAERDIKCANIRAEIARQQSIGQMGAAMQTNAMMAMAYQAKARQNIAYLEARYSQIQCDVIRVAPTAPIAPAQQVSPPAMTFDECYARCGALTSRTDAECFDACRH